MNRKARRPKIVSVAIFIMLMTFFSSCGFESNLNRQVEVKRNISLILKAQSGDYWKTVRMGADAAAKELNVTVNFSAPSEETDIEGQIKMVEDAIESKTDAIILAASDYKRLVDVVERAHAIGIPVIIIDSEVDTKRIDSYIATDNFDAGRKAGEELVKMSGKNVRVAVMSFVKEAGSASQREKGFEEYISQYPGITVAAKEYCLSDSKLAAEMTKEIIKTKGKIDAIVSLNANASVGVARAIDGVKLSGRIKIIAFDNTLEEIEYLDKGVIQATVMQNPFSMGYLGVKHAVEAAEGKKVPKRVDTGSKVISKDNLYLPENQRLLFPFVK